MAKKKPMTSAERRELAARVSEWLVRQLTKAAAARELLAARPDLEAAVRKEGGDADRLHEEEAELGRPVLDVPKTGRGDGDGEYPDQAVPEVRPEG